MGFRIKWIEFQLKLNDFYRKWNSRWGQYKLIAIPLLVVLLSVFIKILFLQPDYNGCHIKELSEQDRIFHLLVKDIRNFKKNWTGQGGLNLDPKLKIVFYKVKKGDNFWNISQRTGLSMDALLSINNLKNVHILQPSQEIRIPNKEGILYRTRPGETLESIAEKFKIHQDDLIDVNELSDTSIMESMDVFIPNAQLDFEARQNLLGTFILPAVGKITSGFSWRRDPLSRSREYHTGIDIANVTGTKVLAAENGTVIFTGPYRGYGNLIILQHKNGYSTRYGHLSRFNVKFGQKVKQGQVIGSMGATGRVTGSHLHFEVRQYGRPRNPYFLMRFSQK
ncbi:MAG: M23 family metallopeptidase [bacterium]|nr:M23 family metallopeptidase [bacterium]